MKKVYEAGDQVVIVGSGERNWGETGQIAEVDTKTGEDCDIRLHRVVFPGGKESWHGVMELRPSTC